MKKIAAIMLLLMSFASWPAWGEEPFPALEQRLIRDGFDADFVTGVYSEPNVTFDPRHILSNFTVKESKLNYGQFLEPKAVESCRAYQREHEVSLEAAHQKYGVAPEIIVAVLMVETRLGAYTGKRQVVNVLSSFAVSADPGVTQSLYDELPPEAQKEYSYSQFERYCQRKAQWAYGELKAFLRYARDEHLPASSINGSMAGAVGFPQFMPSNISRYGRDGDQDGKVDLLNHADAHASIANYLQDHGWKDDLSIGDKRKVLLTYNRSGPYVDTILSLAVAMHY